MICKHCGEVSDASGAYTALRQVQSVLLTRMRDIETRLMLLETARRKRRRAKKKPAKARRKR